MRKPTAAVRRLSHRITDDRGAILVFTALGLVVFMAFAAAAVDLSALFATRRHAQTAADLGALAGAQSAGTSSDPALAKLAIIGEVEANTATNLDVADWSSCVDSDMPPEFSPVAGETPCISFTAGLKKIRVRVPDQTFNTLFAGVMGVPTLSTSAVAVVEAWDQTNGDILPFGIPTGDAASTLGCPSDHPNGLFPCDGSDSGNFNRLEILQLGIKESPGKDCTHSNGMYADNIADGIDHALGTYPESLEIETKTACEDGDFNDNDPWGTITSQPGVAASTLAPGLITGSPQFDGRLADITHSSAETTVFSVSVDDTPLWYFISNYGLSTDIPNVPDSCQGPTFTGGTLTDWDEDLWVHATPTTKDPLVDDPVPLESADSFEHMARCLREYRFGEWSPGDGHPTYAGAGYDGIAGTGVLFGKASGAAKPDVGIYDLQLSARWGWSPVGDFGGGSTSFQIRSFVPIYINTLVSNCTGGPKGECNWIWHAGQTTPPGTPKTPQITSLISFQLPAASLPATVHEYGPMSKYETPFTLIE